ncbi:hypothetical protein PLICRDRAFT_693314 [Plicaturopsis crispa FD-325 SS-3]|nr:hypothetical protein PLICRDRAFT_693314 [Plicaturopsis crispa FD-325 SS-3]
MTQDVHQLALDDVNALGQPEVLEDARRWIKDGVAEHKASLRSCNSKMNALAPISKLSPELLCEIFSWCCCHTFRRRPIRVSHVCQYWRTIAIGYAPLWSTFPAKHPDWTRELLARSKSAPIVFDLTPGPCYRDHDLLDSSGLVLSHLSRIADLRLAAYPYAMEELLKTLSGPSPLLEGLYLHAGRLESLLLPRPLCSIITARLRRLELIGVGLDIAWDTLPLNNLTCLTLCLPESSTKPTLLQLLDILDKSPALSALELGIEACRPSPDPDIDHAKKIALPMLSSINIALCVHDWNALARHIEFPASASMNISLYVDDPGEIPFILPNTLAIRDNERHPQELHCLRFGMDDHDEEPYVKSWTSDAIEAGKSPCIDIGLQPYHRPHSDDILAKQAFVFAVCRTLPLAHLCQMTIDCSLSTSQWITLLRKCPSVECITIRDAIPSLYGLIDAFDAASGDCDNSTPFLPSLCRMNIIGVQYEIPGWSLQLDQLRNVLKTRSDCGVPLELLRFRRCPQFNSRALVSRFAGIVQNVEC